MARIDIVRHVAADPPGLALLLSGPTGRELWEAGALLLGAPRRSGMGFRVDLATAAPALARGRILISTGADGPVASEVRLTLSADGDAAALRAAAVDYLDALADVAQARSSAA